MARTVPLRRLAALSEASSRAGAAGIDVPELLGRRSEFAASDEGLTRRDLLKRAAVAGAGLTVAGRYVLQPERAAAAGGQPRIAIIGAGISGMTAAMTLKDAGFTNVTVYEASDRVGGRTYTRKNDGFWEAGQWSEWGGEFIDTTHTLVMALCQRFGFGLIDLQSAAVNPDGANDTLYFDGGYYTWDAMLADWKAGGLERQIKRDMSLLPKWPWAYNDPRWSAEGIALDNMNGYDWIESRVPGGHTSRLGQFIDVAYNIEYGEETQRQGATDLLGLLGFPAPGPFWIYEYSDERWKIVGGNQQISLAQADYLGASNIRLGWSLASLRRNANGTVTSTFNVGNKSTNVDADHVILAIPLGVMKTIKSTGGFNQAFGNDARKLGFIDALGFGANNKLQLQIADRFWTKPGPWGPSDGESYSDTGYQEAWHVTAGQPGRTGIITDYTGGDTSRLLNPSKAWSDTSDPSAGVRAYVRSAAQTFLAQIEPVYPGMTAKWTGKATLSAWHVSPYQRGAYAYWTPGYTHNYSTYERVPIGPIHFAGEHTSSDFQGYIEGAAEEGQRAANEIIAGP